jgi:glyoxylase-like metal-dependent hydrolase (beta-lactamase superfamily II)
VLSLSQPWRVWAQCLAQCLALLPALWLAAGPVAAAPVEPATVPMDVIQVADNAYYVQGLSALGSAANQNFISNAAFVVTDDGVVVIDALGSPPLAQRLLVEIRKRTAQPVKWVIVTHYHADHIYGLQVFRDQGATIVAHTLAHEYLASDTARLRLQASREELFPWVDEHTRLVPADRWVGIPDSHADTLLRVGHTDFLLRPVGPSHTPEDLVVFVPSLRLLFSGDLMFRGRIPFVGQADSGGWIRALDRLLALDAQIVVPGHGPLSTEPRADMTLTRDYLQTLRERMGEAARNMEPFDEAYDRTDWSRFSGLPLFKVANRMNAYNTYLQMERETP